MKPILYLDLDDTILINGMPVHNSQAFFEWIVEHFEMRWLTAWIPDGVMNDYQAKVLSKRFDGKIGMREFQKYHNPRGFENSKIEGIDFEETRPWVWVENRPSTREAEDLIKSGFRDRFYLTDLRENDPHAVDNPIAITWAKLKRDFKIK